MTYESSEGHQRSPRLLQNVDRFPCTDRVIICCCFLVHQFCPCTCRFHCRCSCHVGLKPVLFATQPKFRTQCLHVLRQFHRLHFKYGPAINVLSCVSVICVMLCVVWSVVWCVVLCVCVCSCGGGNGVCLCGLCVHVVVFMLMYVCVLRVQHACPCGEDTGVGIIR